MVLRRCQGQRAIATVPGRTLLEHADAIAQVLLQPLQEPAPHVRPYSLQGRYAPELAPRGVPRFGFIRFRRSPQTASPDGFAFLPKVAMLLLAPEERTNSLRRISEIHSATLAEGAGTRIIALWHVWNVETSVAPACGKRRKAANACPLGAPEPTGGDPPFTSIRCKAGR